MVVSKWFSIEKDTQPQIKYNVELGHSKESSAFDCFDGKSWFFSQCSGRTKRGFILKHSNAKFFEESKYLLRRICQRSYRKHTTSY